jgi:glutamate N-acetyltransferase/amino-acid N-acetyltransferase
MRADTNEFADALLKVCQGLAQKIARDGEGASKLLTVNVTGARNEAEAMLAARAVARSPLVKSAVHGNDPNWGRILVAVGYSGAISDMAGLRIALQTFEVYHGAPRVFEAELISESMKVNDVVIDIDLAAGQASATAWGCDLSPDYVHINADYTT